MELREIDLEAYLRLAQPDATGEQLARLREAFAKGERRLADIRVAADLRAAVRLVSVGGETHSLVGPFGDDDVAAGLVAEAMERVRELGARIVRARPDAKRVGARYRAALSEHGFALLGERVEFKAPVADLPLDQGTPLLWRDLAVVGEETAAAMLKETAVGDPHSTDEDEDPRAALADWLGAPRLKTGPDCVQVGFLDGRPVAFVCAQVAPHDGWSRVTYLGVVPELRGRGLGGWVHRRGFRMLREQGGKLYHGGTSTANPGMLRLFEKHGCEEVMRMLEFEWRG